LVNSSAVGNQKRKHKSRSSKQPATARARWHTKKWYS
jgi:hypothetical protein